MRMTIERASSPAPASWATASPRSSPTSGRTVDLYEPDLARAEAGRERIAGNLDRAVAKGRLDATAREEILDRIAATDQLAAAADADLVVEAIFEDEDVKRALWAEIDGLAPGRAIFASNTSSISIDRLAEALAPGRRARLLRDALLQPGPGHAARRADPRQRHRRRDDRGDPGPGGRPRASR